MGILLSGAVSALARLAQALRGLGPPAAAAVGTAVFRGGGVLWSSVLLAFFGSSLLLTRLPGTSGSDRRGRTGRQVLANGAVAGLAALLRHRWPNAPYVFSGAIAAAWADTWATELGIRYGGAPRLLVSGARVPPGTSGGVTLIGTLAGAAGAGLCGLAARMAGIAPFSTTALSGILGMLLDSLLGATVQANDHGPLRLDNDAVNLLATAFGALLAAYGSSGSLKMGRMPRWKMSSRS